MSIQQREGRRVLVVGNTSVVGKRLITALSRQYEVQTAGRSKQADYHIDLATVERESPPPAKFDTIVHCAASMLGDEPEQFVANEIVNSVGSLKVAYWAHACDCRHIVYLSTIFASYDATNEYFGSYGLSKRHGQENLKLFCERHAIGFAAIALSQIYDETGEAQRHQPFFYHILHCAEQGHDVILFGTNDPDRNYIFLDDVVEVIEGVVSERLQGEFACVHPRSHRISEIAEIAFGVYGNGGRVRFDPVKPNIRNVEIPRDHTLYERLNLSPKTDLRLGIQLIRDHKRSNPLKSIGIDTTLDLPAHRK